MRFFLGFLFVGLALTVGRSAEASMEYAWMSYGYSHECYLIDSETLGQRYQERLDDQSNCGKKAIAFFREGWYLETYLKLAGRSASWLGKTGQCLAQIFDFTNPSDGVSKPQGPPLPADERYCSGKLANDSGISRVQRKVPGSFW